MTLERIRVSDNGRFFVTESGQPFIWLADTAWELFHRLTLAESEHYLEVRRQQGFTVIQAAALAEFDGLHTPNANGHIPLLGDDPTRPNPFYFRHMDAIIRLAASKGLVIGLLPTWGDKVHAAGGGIGPLIFTTQNAYHYGYFLGERYRHDPNIIWILGGDRPASGDEALWGAMAEGITAGLGRSSVMTFHPPGGKSSSAWFHQATWLGFNGLQSGHVLLDTPNWEGIQADYQLTPTKPTLDMEPNYDHHPIDPFLRQWRPEHGRYGEYDVRKQAYRAVFAGACGHTYGSHSVWQFWTHKREPINYAMPTWDEAIYAPAAQQLIHLKNLLLSRPYLTRIPDATLLPDTLPSPPVGDLAADRLNSTRAAHPVATRCAEGRYALVYFPQAGQRLTVDLGLLMGRVQAQWLDPRTGETHALSEYPATRMTFTSPLGGPDWVLVLDAIL